MVKYLAVIKDSFREAIASRVLWVLLVLITLLLGLLAPLGYRETITTRFNDKDILNLQELVERVRAAAASEEPSAARRVWELLDRSMQTRLQKFDPESGNVRETMSTARRFIGQLNRLIENPDFYDPKAWRKVALLTPEGQTLARRYRKGEELEATEIARLNRLALEAAFPDVLKEGLDTSLQFRYISYDIFEALPVTKAEFDRQVTSWAAFVIKWFVGVIGVAIAILVTASIIPQMFDPGSLNLLLSKPVSRSLLFVSKYLGGCAFTFVLAAYLIGGLWVLLGLRFGIWEPTLLASILIYVFVFGIYYSVSALTGVIWRNSLISIALTFLFGGVCFLVGQAKTSYQSFALDKYRFVRLIEGRPQTEDGGGGRSLFAVNTIGFCHEWNETTQSWDEVFVSDSQRALRFVLLFAPEPPPPFRPVGPAYDAKTDRLINIQRIMRRGSGVATTVGVRDKNWQSQSGVAPPSGVLTMLSEPGGSVLVLSAFGIYRLEGDPLQKTQSRKLFNLIRIPSAGSAYRSVGPDPSIVITRPYDAAVDPQSGGLAIYSRGAITVLNKGADGKFTLAGSKELELGDSKDVKIAWGSGNLLVCKPDGTLLLLDSKSLEEKHRLQATVASRPWLVSGSPDGLHFAVTYRNGYLDLVDGAAGTVRRASVRGQGEISATLFPDSNSLLVTHQATRVTEYDVERLSVKERFAPAMGVVEIAYRYFVLPVYTLFPKPGELDRTIDYLLSSADSAKEIERPWEPVWSSLLFTVAVLALSCLYVSRQDF